MSKLDELNEAMMALWVLDDEITNRRLTEAVLGLDGGWLQRQHDKMSQLRKIVKTNEGAF